MLPGSRSHSQHPLEKRCLSIILYPVHITYTSFYDTGEVVCFYHFLFPAFFTMVCGVFFSSTGGGITITV